MQAQTVQKGPASQQNISRVLKELSQRCKQDDKGLLASKEVAVAKMEDAATETHSIREVPLILLYKLPLLASLPSKTAAAVFLCNA